MTLVVGRVKSGKIYILGDTALTLYNRQKQNPFVDGCLKQYLVTDKLAIAFAGNLSDFEKVCFTLLSSRSGPEAVGIALDAQSRGLDFELLIGEIGREHISVVKDGSATESTAGFIGDPSAFAAFQKYFHEPGLKFVSAREEERVYGQILKLPEPRVPGEIYGGLYDALKRVIWDPQVQNVGGILVPLCTDKGKFRYQLYADIVSDPLKMDDFSGPPKTIQFGTASAGGYSVEFCDDTPYGGDGKNIGFYFLQGGFGVVFQPNSNGLRTAHVVKAENPAYWVLETTKLLGHGIGSGYLSADYCGIAGEELLQARSYKDALFCYELQKKGGALAERPDAYDRYFAGYAFAMENCGKSGEAIAMLKKLLETNGTLQMCKSTLQELTGT